MKRPLDEIKQTAKALDIPVICAGDIFDKWNSSAELINFALENLPERMYTIPGQHDLPYHSQALIERSAYWTLVRAGRITHLADEEQITHAGRPDLVLHTFPWGTPLWPLTGKKQKNKIYVAVVHKYCWIFGSCYPGAPPEGVGSVSQKKLQGYDVAVFGDNHQGFLVKSLSKPVIFNCGGFMRRKSDERDYRPQVGILKSDGLVTPLILSDAGDVFGGVASWAEITGATLGLTQFVGELEQLSEQQQLSFLEALKRYMQKQETGPSIQKLVYQLLEGEVDG
jgi:hypothetical protein